MTQAPIVANIIDGHPVAAGTAAEITAALGGAQALTITGHACNGDVVWLRPRLVHRDDAVTVTGIAQTIEHPEHGTIHYAWINLDRLDQAPALARRQRETAQAARQAEQTAADAVPACDNCGDCHLCV